MSPSLEDRRSALVRFVLGTLGVVTAGLAGLVGLTAAPRVNGVPSRWRPVISLLDLPPDAPPLARACIYRRDHCGQTGC